MIIIPWIYIKTGFVLIAIITLMILAWRTRYMKPVRLKIKELRIRYHGRDAALNRAIRKAKRKHYKSAKNGKEGKRYRVIFLGMRYRVLHRDDVRQYKRVGFFRRDINVTKMDDMIFFDTNSL